ncbi:MULTISPECIES: hypothetical protein [Sphingomonadaceae]|uniref:hypothetical protein n=1 Tax=Sphingomonadales TaxID=204457 RepID=UPI0002ED0AD7|nr:MULTISPECIES: hypothetical protein [Sphingomonadaceae]NBB40114.1 hypothetical protein [Sphingobium yanoikuyae]
MENELNMLTLEPAPSKRVLRDQIERLSISADAKALLNDLLDVVIEVGGRVIAAGRQILAFIFDLVRRFPNTTFGVIVALVVSSLITSIPLLGLILGPLLSPLLLAFGLVAGAIADLKDAPLRARVVDLERHFASATRNG